MDFTQRFFNYFFPQTGFPSNQRINPGANPDTNKAFSKFLDLFEWAYQVKFNFPQQGRIFQEIAKAWNNADKTDNDLMIYFLDLHFLVIKNKWDLKYRKQLQNIFVDFFTSTKDNDAIRIMAIVQYCLEEMKAGITGVNVRHQYIQMDFEQAQPNFQQLFNPNFQPQFNPNFQSSYNPYYQPPYNPGTPLNSNTPNYGNNSVIEMQANIDAVNRKAEYLAMDNYRDKLMNNSIRGILNSM